VQCLYPIALFLAALLCGWPSGARAADFVVGVQELDYFPIYATDGNGRYMGYARELLDLFASTSGHRFAYRPLPIKRLVNDYLLGQTDFMFPDNPRWDAEAKKTLAVRYSAPAVTFQDAVLVLPERRGQPMQSLGSVRGFTLWKFMAQVRSGSLSLQEAAGPRNLIQMALAQRVDGINQARQVAEFHLKDMGRPTALVVDASLLPSTDSQYLLSSIRHPEVIRQFDQFLQTHAAAVAALKLKYGL
jgi:hypothetical protein